LPRLCNNYKCRCGRGTTLHRTALSVGRPSDLKEQEQTIALSCAGLTRAGTAHLRLGALAAAAEAFRGAAALGDPTAAAAAEDVERLQRAGRPPSSSKG